MREVIPEAITQSKPKNPKPEEQATGWGRLPQEPGSREAKLRYAVQDSPKAK